ncbi:nucleoside hydrolase [Thalassobacillus hwangdonensis]|uniref:Nucleoside hydrolase n=1 Tax=Thalassobacillus hwangdonensis TaxID=546108 RepID=A0ABW3KWH8_9BACI
MKNVLIFADPGVDDAFALMYALLHPEINITGIVSGYGNVSQVDALKNAAYLLNLADRKDIPLISGATGPLSGTPPEYFYNIHGEKGLGGIEPLYPSPSFLYPFPTIFDIISTYKDDLTIVNLSRMTTLAMCFLQPNNNLQDVDEIIVMGGAFLVPGNATPLAEANVYGDPDAAEIVARNGQQLTFVPLNISNRAVISKEIIKYVKQFPTPFSSIIEPILSYYSKQYKPILPTINGAPLHDVTLLSYLLNKSRYSVVQKQIFVLTAGPSKGMTYADFRAVPEPLPFYPINKMILDFDAGWFVQDFINVLSGQQKNA